MKDKQLKPANALDLFRVLFATIAYDLRRPFSDSKNESLKKGYHQQKGFLREADCAKAFDELMQLVKKNHKELNFADMELRGKHGYDQGMLDIKNIDKELPCLVTLCKIELVKQKINCLTGLELKIKNINCYYNNSVLVTRGLHVDSHAKLQYKAFIYLTDVKEDSDGPYCYVPYSNNFSLRRYLSIIRNFKNRSHLTNFENHKENALVKLHGARGDLIISNQNGAHRGWPQKKNSERMLISINFED